ncbi:MAG: tyrosine recombinase XerC [Burkholderiales bacterium]
MSADLRDRYLAYLAYEKRLSALTCTHYRRDLDALLDSAKQQPLKELTSHDVRRLLASLHSKGLGGRSLARMLSAWRGFFTFLAMNHGYKTNPCIGLRPPKSAKRLPNALSPDQMAGLLDIKPENALETRDKAIIELAYSSGLRVSELTGLDFSSVSGAEQQVMVTGKGAKTRIVPVGKVALAALAAWRAVRATLAKPNEVALFVGRNGRRLGVRAIQARLKAWARRQGLRLNVHPHMLRHSFASHVLQSSGDLRAVQEMLGHASIASTQVYTHLDFQHLAKIYDEAHPRAKRR